MCKISRECSFSVLTIVKVEYILVSIIRLYLFAYDRLGIIKYFELFKTTIVIKNFLVKEK